MMEVQYVVKQRAFRGRFVLPVVHELHRTFKRGYGSVAKSPTLARVTTILQNLGKALLVGLYAFL